MQDCEPTIQAGVAAVRAPASAHAEPKTAWVDDDTTASILDDEVARPYSGQRAREMQTKP